MSKRHLLCTTIIAGALVVGAPALAQQRPAGDDGAHAPAASQPPSPDEARVVDPAESQDLETSQPGAGS